LSERYLCFRHAYELAHLPSRVGDNQRLRVGVADILGRGNRDAPGNEPRIFPGIEHLRKPVQSGVRIRTAQALDES